MTRRSTILLVEDSPDDALFFQKAIREGGHDCDVRTAQSSQEAIDYLQCACHGGEVPNYPVPRFIILDNGMPSGAGSDLLRWISKHPIVRVVPTVMLSGSDQPSEVKLAFDLGVHGYFVKPMGKTELGELLKMIFNYWAQSSIPPVSEYKLTARGEEPVLKTEGR